MQALDLVIAEPVHQLRAQALVPDTWYMTWSDGLAFASTFLSVR